MLPMGLLAAILVIAPQDPTRLDVVYFHDAQAASEDFTARYLSLRSEDGPITPPGKFRLVGETDDGEVTTRFTLEFVAASAVSYRFSVTREGHVLARGLALAAPEQPGKLLASGWTGEVEPYGVARYSILDADTIEGYYISKMTPEQPGTDMVSGDTRNGFSGSFTLNSKEVNGRTWGPHEWTLTPRGDITYLRWREDGRVISRGFGIADPQDPRSIVVAYIPVAE
ncbi:hypothetical protein E4634_15795 [Mangrovimicrobium sediminis]|uniref:Uncharacterized protein n=1 Tax=Mangrovimicrobium sediminis TaxID=2562682 RepID=A0A4Z0LY28_9GAMM|nr:hypothetical protein [Haliea sp. SAOS-164]TGD72134.1 hypothetical protein E4634_15795 [Haliea sp. SAOS-164]